MSEQALTVADLDFLRTMQDGEYGVFVLQRFRMNMTLVRLIELGLARPCGSDTKLGILYQRTPAGDTLLATVDQQVKEAVEAERRAIDATMDGFFGSRHIFTSDDCTNDEKPDGAVVWHGGYDDLRDQFAVVRASQTSATEGES